MPPFPLILSVPTGISFLVPGIENLLIVLKEVAEAGGMATVLNVLFFQISMVFIRVVEGTLLQRFTGQS